MTCNDLPLAEGEVGSFASIEAPRRTQQKLPSKPYHARAHYATTAGYSARELESRPPRHHHQRTCSGVRPNVKQTPPRFKQIEAKYEAKYVTQMQRRPA